MKSRSDDELWAFEQRYLGPPGKTFIFHARYRAWGLFILYLITGLFIRQVIGISASLISWAIVLSISVIGATLTMRLINSDRPILSVVALLNAELTAPRPNRRPQTQPVDPRTVRIRPRHTSHWDISRENSRNGL